MPILDGFGQGRAGGGIFTSPCCACADRKPSRIERYGGPWPWRNCPSLPRRQIPRSLCYPRRRQTLRTIPRHCRLHTLRLPRPQIRARLPNMTPTRIHTAANSSM